MTTVRRGDAADAAAMATIHAAAFDQPWDAEVIAGFLRCGGFALVTEPTEAGFILCRQAATEAEILTLAVHPTHRRRGLGATLVSAAVDQARQTGAEALFLEVACDNAAALALYRAGQFAEVGRRKAYYSRPDGAMDALVLRRDLNR